tara:strand:- start:55 stop:588 length:534 start_codon:yes stop_codon:yes gene_type:complete
MSGYNMNNINPFGDVVQRRSPSSDLDPGLGGITNTAPTEGPDSLSGGQEVMGEQPIRQYLMPLLGRISHQMSTQLEEEKRNKIEPYLQEVQQLTDRTFPDFRFGEGGLRGGIGSLFGQRFMSGGQGGIGGLFGGGMNSLGGLRPPESGVQFGVQTPQVGASQSLQNLSPFRTSSLFR